MNILPATAVLKSILQGLLYKPSKKTGVVLEGTTPFDQLAELLQALEVVPSQKSAGADQLTLWPPLTKFVAVTSVVAFESVTLT